jgi:hypothetical protein
VICSQFDLFLQKDARKKIAVRGAFSDIAAQVQNGDFAATKLLELHFIADSATIHASDR